MATETSIHIWRGLPYTLMATRLLLRYRTQPYVGRGVYISIVIHRQICFVLSDLFRSIYIYIYIYIYILFFQAAVTSILLYVCPTWTLTKRLEKKLDGNYTRMLRAILNKSWRQHPIRHQLYGHLPPITKTIQVRRTRHAGHCWRSRDDLIRDVLLWTPTHCRAKAGRPARTYIQQLCEDTGCCLEDLPGAMSDREEWRERVRDIRVTSETWRWWYIYIFTYIRSIATETSIQIRRGLQ